MNQIEPIRAWAQTLYVGWFELDVIKPNSNIIGKKKISSIIALNYAFYNSWILETIYWSFPINCSVKKLNQKSKANHRFYLA